MWELLRRNPKFIGGAVVLGVIVMFGVIGPMFTRDPTYRRLPISQPPNNDLTLGTTGLGQDVFAQLCIGIRNSLIVGLLSGGLGTLIAILFGALGAYKGGLTDEISNFITNIVMVFPVFSALIVLAYILESRSLILVGLLIAVTGWPWAARCIRSQVLSLKEREFINLARMSGMRSIETAVKEVLPNMFAYILMVFVLLTGGAIIAEAGISMLGLGPDPNINVTLGSMLYNCMNYYSPYSRWTYMWWWYLPPGIVLTTLLSSTFVMHAGMDEVFNPRLRRM